MAWTGSDLRGALPAAGALTVTVGLIVGCGRHSGPDADDSAPGDTTRDTDTSIHDTGDTHDSSIPCPDADNDGVTTCDGDCDDTKDDIYPGATESPANATDNDCDGTGVVTVVPLGDAAVVYDGTIEGQGAGSDVAIAGDLDGDGVPDLIIGARTNGATESTMGSAYVVAGGSAMHSENLDDVGSSVHGGDAFHVDSAGDPDEDTMEDFAFVSPGTVDLDRNAEGVAYFVSGTPPSDIDVEDVAVARIWGAAGRSPVVMRARRLGDADGDGIDDVMVEAAAMGAGTFGEVGVFGGPLPPVGVLDDADATLNSPTGNVDSIGAIPSIPAGDLDSDGHLDVLVSTTDGVSSSEDGPSKIHIAHGPFVGPRELGSEGTLTTADGDGGVADLSVDDFDGDGMLDIAVGNGVPGGASGAQRGVVYVAFGPFAGTTDLSVADVVMEGEGDLHRFGMQIEPGDYNGDGQSDLAVAATGPGYDTSFGGIYLFLGPLFEGEHAWQADLVFEAEATSDAAGEGLSMAGDVDGDGKDDLAIGAPKRIVDGAARGRVYVEYGEGP